MKEGGWRGGDGGVRTAVSDSRPQRSVGQSPGTTAPKVWQWPSALCTASVLVCLKRRDLRYHSTTVLIVFYLIIPVSYRDTRSCFLVLPCCRLCTRGHGLRKNGFTVGINPTMTEYSTIDQVSLSGEFVYEMIEWRRFAPTHPGGNLETQTLFVLTDD